MQDKWRNLCKKFDVPKSSLKWTTEEEEALRAGVEKHGVGKWVDILSDSQFASSLCSRSNINLKVLFFVHKVVIFSTFPYLTVYLHLASLGISLL